MMIASRLRFVSVNLTRRSPHRESYRPLREEALLVRLDALYESLAYAVVAVLILVTGIALVQDGHWGWSSTFIWVGIATILAGATLGGIGLEGLGQEADRHARGARHARRGLGRTARVAHRVLVDRVRSHQRRGDGPQMGRLILNARWARVRFARTPEVGSWARQKRCSTAPWAWRRSQEARTRVVLYGFGFDRPESLWRTNE